MSIKFDDDN